MRMSMVRFRCFKVPVRYLLIFLYLSYSCWYSCTWPMSSSFPKKFRAGSIVNLSILILVSWARIFAFSRLDAKGRFFNSLIDGIPFNDSWSFYLCDAESPNPKFRLSGKLSGLIGLFMILPEAPVNADRGVSIGCCYRFKFGLYLGMSGFCVSNRFKFWSVIGRTWSLAVWWGESLFMLVLGSAFRRPC